MEYVYFFLISFFGAFLGIHLKSYFSEKGKNLATKEDISQITESVEYVKSQFSKSHIRSKAYIEKQIEAYQELDALLYDFKMCFFSGKEIESIDNFKKIFTSEDGNFDVKIMHAIEKNALYICLDTEEKMVDLIGLCVCHRKFNDNTSQDIIDESLEKIMNKILQIRELLKSNLIS